MLAVLLNYGACEDAVFRQVHYHRDILGSVCEVSVAGVLPEVPGEAHRGRDQERAEGS